MLRISLKTFILIGLCLTIKDETGLSQIEAEVDKNLDHLNQEFQNFENQKVPKSMILHLKAQAEFHELLANGLLQTKTRKS